MLIVSEYISTQPDLLYFLLLFDLVKVWRVQLTQAKVRLLQDCPTIYRSTAYGMTEHTNPRARHMMGDVKFSQPLQ